MHQSGLRRDTVWLFVTSYFVVMDVSSHFFLFFFFHLNCQLLFREQKGWQVCAPDPDGHSTKRELVREPGLVLCSLWLIAIQNLSGSFILALLLSQFKYFQLYRVEKKGKKCHYFTVIFFKLHLCSRVISQIIQLSLPVFILSAEAAPQRRCWITTSSQSRWFWPLASPEEGERKRQIPYKQQSLQQKAHLTELSL